MATKNNVKKFRESMKLSKRELARRAGINVKTLNRVELGLKSRNATKRKIIEALCVPVENAVEVFPEIKK